VRPSLILVRTHIGYGSPNKHDSFEAHGSPLGVEEVRLTKQNLDWPAEPPFLIPEAALVHFRSAVARGARDEAASSERMVAYAQAFPDLAGELQRTLRGELPRDWDTDGCGSRGAWTLFRSVCSGGPRHGKRCLVESGPPRASCPLLPIPP